MTGAPAPKPPARLAVALPPEKVGPPADAEGRQWIHLVPAGTFKGKDGRGPFRLSDPDAVIRASFAESGGRHLPVDYNHAIDFAAPKGGASPAAGWIERMEARDDGIWGLVTWTKSALQALKDKEYRFLSPALYVTAKEKEVHAVLRASLTNDPNLMLTALNSAEKDFAMDDDELWAELRKELGLPEDADGAAILKAVKDRGKSLNSADPAKFVPFSVFQATVDELHRVNSGVSLQAAERAVEEAIQHGRMLPAMRSWAIELCTANKPAFDGFLDRIASSVKFLSEPGISRDRMAHLNSRQNGKGAGDDQIAQRLGLSDDDVKKYGGK